MVITTATNLIQLQKHLKSVVKENSELCKTRNGTRVITKTLVDFAAVRSHLETHNLSYFTFYPKSLKPIKAIIHHLPISTLAEGSSSRLVSLGFDIISVKQLSTTRGSAEGTGTKNLPIFLVTLPRTEKVPRYFLTA
jgi:hypothetical protein